MILPSGASTADYSRLANSRGWGPGWPVCGAIGGGQIEQVRMARSGTSIAGGVHRNIVELFGLIGNEVERRGYLFHPGWCWGASCRAISGTSTPSNHSWGLAVDINAPNNPYTSSGVHDIPDWAFALFRSYGFGVGADYSGKKDWMHVEFMGSPSDAAIMTGLARKNIGGGGPVDRPTEPQPQPTGDDELSAAEVQQILDAIGYGNDKVMEGKNGEPPNHNIKQVKDQLAAVSGELTRSRQDVSTLRQDVSTLRQDIASLRGLLFQPGMDTPGHSIREEVMFQTDKILVPKLDDIKASLPKG